MESVTVQIVAFSTQNRFPVRGLDVEGGRAIDQVLIREGFKAVEQMLAVLNQGRGQVDRHRILDKSLENGLMQTTNLILTCPSPKKTRILSSTL